MELRQLEVFVTVARVRNITRAAGMLDLTPSPVSRTVRELERGLGRRLFDREYHELVMTRAGQELLPKALEMLRLAGIVKGQPAAPLRVGSSPWGAQRFARKLVAAAAELGHDLDLEEAMSSELIEKLQFGDLDLALVHLPVDVPGLDLRVVAEYRQYLAGASRDNVDLQSRKTLVLPTVMNAGTTDQILAQLAEMGQEDVEQIEFSELVTLSSRLRRTGELIVTPKAEDTAIAAFLDLGALEFTELPDQSKRTRLAIAWRTDNLSKRDICTALVDALAPPGSSPEIV